VWKRPEGLIEGTGDKLGHRGGEQPAGGADETDSAGGGSGDEASTQLDAASTQLDAASTQLDSYSDSYSTGFALSESVGSNNASSIAGSSIAGGTTALHQPTGHDAVDEINANNDTAAAAVAAATAAVAASQNRAYNSEEGDEEGEWETRWSERYQSHYYVNRATRKSVWKRPEAMIDSRGVSAGVPVANKPNAEINRDSADMLLQMQAKKQTRRLLSNQQANRKPAWNDDTVVEAFGGDGDAGDAGDDGDGDGTGIDGALAESVSAADNTVEGRQQRKLEAAREAAWVGTTDEGDDEDEDEHEGEGRGEGEGEARGDGEPRRASFGQLHLSKIIRAEGVAQASSQDSCQDIWAKQQPSAGGDDGTLVGQQAESSGATQSTADIVRETGSMVEGQYAEGDGEGEWEVRWSKRYQSHYYVNRETRKSVWKRPEGLHDPGTPSGGGGGDGSSSSSSSNDEQASTGGVEEEPSYSEFSSLDTEGRSTMSIDRPKRRSFGELQLSKMSSPKGGRAGGGGASGGGPRIWAQV
jgi:hypothetical protein